MQHRHAPVCQRRDWQLRVCMPNRHSRRRLVGPLRSSGDGQLGGRTRASI